ncbi:hypothetical protein [Streptomyces sp. AA1529]|uniref:hypothetical protein n=1 Tax=Streptomyces sp. AA1529 TaxID=1203257 RepID=UPI003D73AB2F
MLVVLVGLLLVLACLLVAGGLGYVVHRQPALHEPLMVSLTGVMMLAAVVAAAAATVR